MAVLNIRSLSNDVHAQLRIRAAKAGRSMEAEARAILEAACASVGVDHDDDADAWASLEVWVDQLYGADKPSGVVEALIAERRQEASRE